MTKRICARCGRKLGKDEIVVYSRHSKNFYCGPKDGEKCKQREKRVKAKLLKEES